MHTLPTQYQQFIHLSRYSKFLHDEGRRESWEETVSRLITFLKKHLTDVEFVTFDEIEKAILNLEVLPSMRALMTAGPAAERDHIALYNCSYLAVDHARAFDETLYILMCGTGVGFSVERQEVAKLPEIPRKLFPSDTTIVVEDSKVGWAKAYKQLISLLYAGEIPKWDTTRLREAGAILKTFGGRSSGPEPLIQLFHFTVKTFEKAAGRKLTSIECHDIMCKIGEIVVVGGVRRSALISLSNLSDLRMRDAKSGQWWTDNPQRALANNSVAYTEKPDVGQFMEEWISLYNSKSGERGIFNRSSIPTFFDKIGRKVVEGIGTNPCGEILLRSNEFCNLTELVARPDDTLETLKKKITLATILGTMQSTFTDFSYIRKKWQHNCEEERLLGVSITGIMDCPLLQGTDTDTQEVFRQLTEHARKVNKVWAAKLGINPSASITCVKPSGTASQLAGSSSGIHPRYAKTYIRRVRQDIKDPLTAFMIDKGFPHEMDVMNSQNVVFSFPMRAPDGIIVDDDMSAIDRLNHWLVVKSSFTEHNPSTTINVDENEWPEVGAWVWKNFDHITGLSFLPKDLGSYRQAPFEKVSSDELRKLEAVMPKDVDWSELKSYEVGDSTKGSQELACVSGVCEI